MNVSHLHIRDVRGIKAMDLTLDDDWRGGVLDAALLVGPNGSGKTTVLNVIASLWNVLGEFIQMESKQSNTRFQVQTSIPLNSGLAELRLNKWYGKRLYVCAGKETRIRDFVSEDPEKNGVDCVIGFGYDSQSTVGNFWFAAKGHTPVAIHTSDQIPDHVLQWIQPLSEALLRNTLNNAKDLPNIVYFPSENRYLNVGSYEPKPEVDAFQWLYTYAVDPVANGGLQNYLFNLKVLDSAAFDRAVQQINNFWNGKQLDGFDQRTRQLMVKTANGARHPINDLSSGEKQVLLMQAHIAQRLRPGGILLIDEPDLHLHPALSMAFVNHLRTQIREQHGQLIVASHSPDLRQMFLGGEQIYLGEQDEVSAF